MTTPQAGPFPDGVVSVCLCTFKRAEQLRELLHDLLAQTALERMLEIIVVDNDAEGSARPVIDAVTADAALPVHYLVQPEQNIAITRNWAVREARGEWLAMMDDDERAPPDWVAQLLATAARYDADGVFGPVIYRPPDDAPEWFRKGDFFSRPARETGSRPPGNKLYTNNVLIRADALRRVEGPFDPAYVLVGGSDTDTMSRVHATGAKLVWCQEAAVTEDVAPNRMQVGWLLRRAERGGRDYAGLILRGQIRGPLGLGRLGLLLDTAVKLPAAAVLSLLALAFPKHLRVRTWRVLAAQVGRLTAFTGYAPEEYRQPP